MVQRSLVVPVLIVMLLCLGCGRSSSELAKVRAELVKTQAELKQVREELAAQKNQKEPPKADKAASYLDELERLQKLVEKNVVTPAEFEAKKQALLKSSSSTERQSLTMTEVVQQLRTVHELYNTSTINASERERKKQQLIERPLVSTDLKADLEAVKAMYNESVINASDRDAINKRILEAEPAKH